MSDLREAVRELTEEVRRLREQLATPVPTNTFTPVPVPGVPMPMPGAVPPATLVRCFSCGIYFSGTHVCWAWQGTTWMTR